MWGWKFAANEPKVWMGAHAAGPNVITLEELLETLADALVGGLREKGEQAAFALEKSSEGLRDCKGVVSMRDRL